MRPLFFSKIGVVFCILAVLFSVSSVTPAEAQTFDRSLTLGSSGEDVRDLQIFLNTHGYVVSDEGVGSPGNESDYFGALTKKALAAFQKANNIYPSVGYFGPLTRSFIEALSSAPAITPTATPPVISIETPPVTPGAPEKTPGIFAPTAPASSLEVSVPRIGTIALSWKKGGPTTAVRRAAKTAPSDPSVGAEVYKGEGTSFDDGSFPVESVICYSAWGYDPALNSYSPTHESKCITLFSSAGSGSSFLPILVPTALTLSNPTISTINLSFVKGTRSTNTVIRRAVNTAPVSRSQGVGVYSGTGTSFADSSLDPDTKYCYSAWGYDSGTNMYSATYTSLCERTIPEDLLAYWKLNETSGGTAADASGNGNNGTWSPAGFASTTGKIGAAAQFSGANYIDIPVALFNARTEFTLSYWIKPDLANDMDTAFCVELLDTSWRLCTFGDSVRLRDNDNLTHDIDLGEFSAGEWYNLTFVYNGTAGQFIPYVNGVSVGTTSVGTAMKNDLQSARIGASVDPGYEFSGAIDDVRLYSVPLSAPEVNAIYLAGN